MEQLLKFLASNTGKLFSARNISDYLKRQQIKIGVQQVTEYVSAISKAFVIDKVPRYDIIRKKVFEVGEKYYFEDLGIRNMLVGYRVQDKAQVLENVVYRHLHTCDYDIKVGYIGDLEIDFVCEQGGEKLYVQVPYLSQDEKTIEREFGNFLKISDNYPKIVVSMDEFTGNTYEGVKHVSLRKFLTEWQ
ncbi:MAG: hypothetical protein LBS52_03615 [Dysgonamonadaceae bacterium]|nr:hypothetical protein [Dysgonamonadaceae bacterium]